MRAKNIFSALVDLIFPPRCVFCGKVVLPSTLVCEKCGKEIICINVVKCIELPSVGKTIPCAVPYPYEGRIRQSIINFKFYGQTQFSGFYAEKMAGHISICFLNFHFDAITSVPISAKRRKLRGYNQSELIARTIGKYLNLPYHEYLIKTEDNKEQHKLCEIQRQRNVKGVYKPKREDRIVGKNILLVDDIVTTGATLRECATVLYQSGASRVVCAAIAEVEFE